MRMESSQRGFSLIEILVTLVVSSLILIGVYRMWTISQRQNTLLQNKIDARNQLALATKRMNQSVTLAGFGLPGVPSMSKSDQVGSDTLYIYSNPNNAITALLMGYGHGTGAVGVQNPSLFDGVSYIAISDSSHGELRAITARTGNVLTLDSGFQFDYSSSNAKVFPARCEKYYTQQDSSLFKCKITSTNTIGRNVRNFQISFKDQNGMTTEDLTQVRSVQFSITGTYPALPGSIDNIVFSGSVIPRNLL